MPQKQLVAHQMNLRMLQNASDIEPQDANLTLDASLLDGHQVFENEFTTISNPFMPKDKR